MDDKHFGADIYVVNSTKKASVNLKYQVKFNSIVKLSLPIGLALGIFLNLFCILARAVGVI